MSVLVKDIKMPIDCRECMMNVYYPSGKTWCEPADRLLAEDFLPIPYDGRPDWCPLVELPKKHGRLIDGDEVITAFPVCDSNMDVKIESVRATIRHMPTVIEAECEGETRKC